MEERVRARARKEHGIVRTADLGAHPGRTAERHALELVQPRVLIAATQPVEAVQQVAAVSASVLGVHVFLGRTALWIYGLVEVPEVVEVGVAHATRYRARPPLRVRRIAPALFDGRRVVQGSAVVALEVAVVQACERQPPGQVLELVELVLRERRTTMSRLRGRCRRGVAGSAAVRRAVDQLAGTSLDAAVRRLREALSARGVEGLRPEAQFVSPRGGTAYVDLLDDEGEVAVEVDGYLTHVERARFRADRRRDRWLHSAHGILTVRVDVDETTSGPELEALADELAALILARRAARAA